MTVRFSQGVAECLCWWWLEFCSWIRPPLVCFPTDGQWAVSFGAVTIKAALQVLVPVFWQTQAFSKLWNQDWSFWVRRFSAKERSAPISSTWSPTTLCPCQHLKESEPFWWVYGGISGFIVCYLDVTASMPMIPSTFSHANWSLGSLFPGDVCSWLLLILKFQSVPSIQGIHEGVLGWKDVLNFSDVYFMSLLWLAVLVCCSGSLRTHQGHEDFHRCLLLELCFTFHIYVSISI